MSIIQNNIQSPCNDSQSSVKTVETKNFNREVQKIILWNYRAVVIALVLEG